MVSEGLLSSSGGVNLRRFAGRPCAMLELEICVLIAIRLDTFVICRIRHSLPDDYFIVTQNFSALHMLLEHFPKEV